MGIFAVMLHSVGTWKSSPSASTIFSFKHIILHAVVDCYHEGNYGLLQCNYSIEPKVTTSSDSITCWPLVARPHQSCGGSPWHADPQLLYLTRSYHHSTTTMSRSLVSMMSCSNVVAACPCFQNFPDPKNWPWTSFWQGVVRPWPIRSAPESQWQPTGHVAMIPNHQWWQSLLA